jgi:hypothetical protein
MSTSRNLLVEIYKINYGLKQNNVIYYYKWYLYPDASTSVSDS